MSVKIGAETERSDTFSDCACHFCACKIIITNSFELNFSNLQKEKQVTIEVSDDSSRCKCVLPVAVLSPDRSPQPGNGHKTLNENFFHSKITMIVVPRQFLSGYSANTKIMLLLMRGTHLHRFAALISQPTKMANKPPSSAG